jgi:hypothetical protein
MHGPVTSYRLAALFLLHRGGSAVPWAVTNQVGAARRMTLIISCVSWYGVHHVSDRMVSSQGKPFDPVANKSVLYVAPDGIMAMSYTGTAYLAGVATDRWIAESLAREKLEEGFGSGPAKSWPPIGLALTRLKHDLGLALNDPKTDPSVKHWPFELQGAGWRWGKKHAKPVAATITKEFGESLITLVHHREALGRNEFRTLAVPAAHATPVVPNLRAGLRGASNAEQVEAALVAAVRERSASVPGQVGTDCMGFQLPPPGYRFARVRYHGAGPVGIALVQPSGKVTATIDHAAFSPWIVGAGTSSSPSVLAGTWSMNVGGFHVELEAPEPTGHIHAAMGPVTPPPPPAFRQS